MRKYLILSILCWLAACAEPTVRNDAMISFGEKERDLGNLIYKKAVEYRFDFSNTGKTSLVISNVKTSCGCTVAEWTHTPVKPGKKGTINIRYDAGFPGVFHKEIKVYYNGAGSPVVLAIKGKVYYPGELEEEQAKQNGSKN